MKNLRFINELVKVKWDTEANASVSFFKVPSLEYLPQQLIFLQ